MRKQMPLKRTDYAPSAGWQRIFGMDQRAAAAQRPFLQSEFADDVRGIAMLSVDGLVHSAHVVRADFAGKGVEGGRDLRPATERIIAHQRDCIVWREVMTIILERNKAERLDRPVGGVGRDHVDLARIECAVEQAEVHGARRSVEMQIVSGAQPGQAVGALLEFVSNAEAPLRRVGRGLAECGEMKALRVVSADDHGEGIFEAERFGDGDAVARCIEPAHSRENRVSGLRSTGCLRMAVSAVPVYST